MRAMTLEKQQPIEESPLQLTELEEPRPGPGEVRVKTSVCATCRTDLHIVEGDLALPRSPLVPGHQVVGTVDQLGEGAGRFREGDRVGIAWLRHTDGSCRFCRRGRENLCPESRYTGYHDHGGYAEYATVPEDFAYRLPGDLDDVTASPLLCAGLIGYRALERAAVPEKGRLLLVGFGSSAHVVIQIAVRRGYRVFVLSRTESHRRLGERMGAEWSGESPGDLPEKMDSAVLFAPVGKLVPPVLEALDRGGTLSLAGIHMSDVPSLSYEKHLFHDRQIRSVEANTREDGRSLLEEAARAGVRPRTTTYPLADANRALTDLKHSRLDGTGVLVLEE
jgi:propanol-preferring alcohol dehydrogenase